MPMLRASHLAMAALLLMDVSSRAAPPGPKPAPPPPVPERCLLGFKPKQVREVRSATLSPTETVVLIDHQKDKASVLGICGEGGPLRSTVNLPRVEPYQDACTILGKCDSAPSDLDGKLQPGTSVLTPHFFEVATGEWTLSVERNTAVDTSSEEGGPGEDISITTLYIFRVSGGKLLRILMMPLKASRSDAELNDSFETTITPDSVGVLSYERTIKNGVYPDSVKERTRRGHLRWNGKRLVLGS